MIFFLLSIVYLYQFRYPMIARECKVYLYSLLELLPSLALGRYRDWNDSCGGSSPARLPRGFGEDNPRGRARVHRCHLTTCCYLKINKQNCNYNQTQSLNAKIQINFLFFCFRKVNFAFFCLIKIIKPKRNLLRDDKYLDFLLSLKQLHPFRLITEPNCEIHQRSGSS